MNKRDPDQVVRQFLELARGSVADWAAINDATRQLSVERRRLLARDAFLRVAVAWEVFRSDWHIAALAKNTTTLSLSIDDEMRKHLRSKPTLKGAGAYVRLDIPKHIPLAAARALIDPDGGNVNLSTKGVAVEGTATWSKLATAHLSPMFANRVTGLSLDDLRFSAFVESLRDCAVHESARSVVALRNAQISLSPDDWRLFGTQGPTTPRSLGRYLHATVGRSPRVIHIHARLVSVAWQLIAGEIDSRSEEPS